MFVGAVGAAVLTAKRKPNPLDEIEKWGTASLVVGHLARVEHAEATAQVGEVGARPVEQGVIECSERSKS
jgi:hypothetical protein